MNIRPFVLTDRYMQMLCADNCLQVDWIPMQMGIFFTLCGWMAHEHVHTKKHTLVGDAIFETTSYSAILFFYTLYTKYRWIQRGREGFNSTTPSQPTAFNSSTTSLILTELHAWISKTEFWTIIKLLNYRINRIIRATWCWARQCGSSQLWEPSVLTATTPSIRINKTINKIGTWERGKTTRKIHQ